MLNKKDINYKDEINTKIKMKIKRTARKFCIDPIPDEILIFFLEHDYGQKTF